MANQHVNVATICSNCNQCCGGFCDDFFASCREACSPCCNASVKFVGDISLNALAIIAKVEESGLYDLFDPDASDGLQKALGVVMHPVVTDDDGNITNFRSGLYQIPGCGEKTGSVFTSGEFLESLLAEQNSAALVEAMLAVPNFAKRIAGGYIRIL